jgi:hypothetical protein
VTQRAAQPVGPFNASSAAMCGVPFSFGRFRSKPNLSQFIEERRRL